MTNFFPPSAALCIQGTLIPLDNPYYYVELTANGGGRIWVEDEDYSYNSGLMTLGGQTLTHLKLEIDTGSLSIPGIVYPETFVSPAGVLGHLSGTYTLSGTMYFEAYRDGTWGTATLTATSLTISSVPEPASAAALLGLGAPGCVSCRRRRTRMI